MRMRISAVHLLCARKHFLNDVKGWGAGAAFMIADNTKLEGLRTFNSESQSGVDKDERTVVQLVYKF